jgi:hypothetical protein
MSLDFSKIFEIKEIVNYTGSVYKLGVIVMKNTLLISASLALLAPLSAHAAAVDLSGWKENGYPNNSAGTWTVQGAGNDSVLQSINGRPTVFFNDGNNAQGKELAGEITVETSFDDDFIGFVLGYQDGEITSTNADFWLIDWKQGNQDGQTAGLALSHVFGDLSGLNTGTTGAWWQHSGPINEVQRGNTLGTTGWADNATNEFTLEFTSSLIKVVVDGNTELEFTSADNGGAAFTDGSFGFYNFSQSSVRYAGITEDVAPSAPVPLPASLPLMLAGLVSTAETKPATWRRKTRPVAGCQAPWCVRTVSPPQGRLTDAHSIDKRGARQDAPFHFGTQSYCSAS